MFFEINVSLNGRHFFATAQRSVTDKHTAAALMVLFREKFPEIDGYSVTCTMWETVGTRQNLEDLF